jgi:hypothetical protein
MRGGLERIYTETEIERTGMAEAGAEDAGTKSKDGDRVNGA